MVNTELLRGPRVWLGALGRADAARMARWDQDMEFARSLDSSAVAPRSEEAIWRWIEGSQKGHDSFIFGVRLRDDDLLIGMVELDGIQWTHRTGYLGIGIGERGYRGHGFGREALELALEFAFDELNLHRICLTVFSYNQRAIRLYESVGFVHEGTHREHLLRDGQRYDMLLYGLLRPEWAARR